MAAFRSFVSAGSCVVIGQPGVGKSYLLKQFVEGLLAANKKCFFLPIDKLGVESEAELIAELNIGGDFVSYLSAQNPKHKGQVGLLVIDAFDAARSEKAQRFFIRLIKRVREQLKDSWSVVVSVRTYDARKSEELQGLFPSSSNDVSAQEFRLRGVGCRHFYVPLLRPDEVAATAKSIPHLPKLYSRGSADFKELLRVPFNLWLLDKILTETHESVEFDSVTSEVQLLQMFWKQRVIKAPSGNEKQHVLTKICRGLVDQRTLSIRTEDTYIPGQESVWESLFSEEILLHVSETRQRIAFSHNILFDYAVSILLIDDEPEELVRFITTDSSRPVFLRPSLHYHCVRLWHANPDQFWRVFWFLIKPGNPINLRLFARLLPAGVVVTEARNLTELRPLLRHPCESEALYSEAALRILQAHQGFNVAKDELWSQFFAALSEHLYRGFAWEISTATMEVLQRAELEVNNESVMSACGKAARNILSWVWKQKEAGESGWIDKLGGNIAVPLVARTFKTSLLESGELLRKILEMLREDSFPIDYIYRLTTLVDKVWPHDPSLISSLYRSIFSHREVSQEVTHFGGVVMPLSSTRRQDFEMAQYNLADGYGALLKLNAIPAAKMGVEILNRHVVAEHIDPYIKNGIRREDLVKVFPFRGKRAKYLPDLSYVWDQDNFPDNQIKIAESLFTHLEETHSAAEIDAILDILADDAVVAFIWRRVLTIASKRPKVFAKRLLELCLASPVQTGAETIRELGLFLETAAVEFRPEEIRTIEESILKLEGSEEDGEEDSIEHREYMKHARDRLLARIPTELLSTAKAKEIRSQMESTSTYVNNEPLVSFTSSSKPFSEDSWLQRQGVDTTRPENQGLTRYFEPIEEFITQWHNKKPTLDAIRLVQDPARNLHSTLNQPTLRADAEVIGSAWTKLAAVAYTMSRTIDTSHHEEFDWARDVLLACAKHELPRPDPNYDSRWDSPSWSSAPRIEAASGLPWLAARIADTRILDAIEKLVKDEVPSVRFLATSELFRVRVNAPDRFWHIAMVVAEHEHNKVVLRALCSTLGRILPSEEEKVAEVLGKLLPRIQSSSEEKDFSEHFVPLVMWLLLEKENYWAETTMTALLETPIAMARPIKRATFDALGYVTPFRLSSPETKEVSEKAIAWLQKSIAAAVRGITQLRGIPKEKWNEKTYAELRSVYSIIDEVIMRLCFSADVIEHIRAKKGAIASDAERATFYAKIKPILNHVLEFALDEKNGVMFGPTAHHFMQLLNGFLSYDPKGVLHMAADVAKSSEPFNYNLDSLAVQEVIKLAESVLADYRADVREGRPLEDLLTLLDIFSRWPESLRLIWRLDEVFR